MLDPLHVIWPIPSFERKQCCSCLSEKRHEHRPRDADLHLLDDLKYRKSPARLTLLHLHRHAGRLVCWCPNWKAASRSVFCQDSPSTIPSRTRQVVMSMKSMGYLETKKVRLYPNDQFKVQDVTQGATCSGAISLRHTAGMAKSSLQTSIDGLCVRTRNFCNDDMQAFFSDDRVGDQAFP